MGSATAVDCVCLSEFDIQGLILKKSNIIFIERWFEIRDGVLSYYSDQTDVTTRRGFIRLPSVKCFKSKENDRDLVLCYPGTQRYELRFDDKGDRKRWLTLFTKCGAKKMSREDYNQFKIFGALAPSLSFPTFTDGEALRHMQSRDSEIIENISIGLVITIAAVAGDIVASPVWTVVNGLGTITPTIYNFFREQDANGARYEAIMDQKILTQAISEMKSEILATETLYVNMVREGIRKSDRTSNVPCIMDKFKKYLANFSDDHNTFRKHPLTTAPYLVQFSYFFTASAGVIVRLTPHNLEELENQKETLISCLEYFKQQVLLRRLNAIRLNYSVIHSLIDQSKSIALLLPKLLWKDEGDIRIRPSKGKVTDKLYPMNGGLVSASARSENRDDELYKDYRNKIKQLYEEYFDEALKQVMALSLTDKKTERKKKLKKTLLKDRCTIQ